MNRSWLGLALLGLFGSTAFAQDAGPAADFAGAVPADAFALVRFRSARELAQRSEEIRVKAAVVARASDEKSVLQSILHELSFEGDTALADPTRPFGLAFSFATNSPEPVATIILPATDAKALANALVSGDTKFSASQSGSYVALSTRAATARADKPSRLASGGPGGIITARVDLAAVVTKFRPMIDMGLDQIEQMADSDVLQAQRAAFDMSAMFEMYAEFGRDVVDSVDVLDVALDLIGPELGLAIALSNREGSPLAKYAHSEKVDYRALAGRIDPQSVLQFIWSYDQAPMFERVMPMYDSAFAAMEKEASQSPEFVAGFRAYMKHVKELLPKFGRTAAGSFDLDQAGMRMSASYAAPDPKGVVQSMLAMMSDPSLAAIGMVVSAPTEVDIAGVKATSFSTNFDIRKLLTIVQASAHGSDASEKDVAEFEHIFAGMFGKDGARVALLPGADRLGMLFGGDDAWRTSAAKRLASGGDAPPGLLRAADLISGSNPAMLMRVDVGRGLDRLAAWMQLIGAEPDALRQVAEFSQTLGSSLLPACMYGGVSGSTWKMGATIDYEGLLRLVKAGYGLQGADKRHSLVQFDVRAIDDAVKHYARDHHGEQPDSLEVLTQPGANGKPYLRYLPKDPWDRAFLYDKKSGDKSRRVYSLGADGQPGGSGENADCDNLNSTSPSIDDLVLPPGISGDQ